MRHRRPVSLVTQTTVRCHYVRPFVTKQLLDTTQYKFHVRHCLLYGDYVLFLVATTLAIFFFHFITSLIPCGKFESPYLGKATAAARAALPIPNRACGIFVCPNEGVAAIAWAL